MITKERDLDFLFVQGPYGLNLTGGDKVVLELALHLGRDRYRVGIWAVRNIDKSIGLDSSSNPLIYKFFSFVFHSELGFKLLNILRRLRGNCFPYSSAENVSFYFGSAPRNFGSVKRLIAVGWKPAILVRKGIFQDSISVKYYYYFTQNVEDEPSYSGVYHKLAAETYDYPFKKIVYNSHLKQRFATDSPITLRLAPFIKHRIYIKPEERPPNNVLVVLRSGESKGARYAIEACDILVKSCSVNLVSFGDYRGKIPKYIRHVQVINNKELVDLYNWASILVLPSLIEGFSLIAAEAMQMGCAVISTDCVGPLEFIKDGYNGAIVPAKDPRTMADRIKELVNDNERRISLARNGIDTSLKFDFNRTYEDFIHGIKSYESDDVID
jgi:glycosyltransferase involved in cell wall biosynthesis